METLQTRFATYFKARSPEYLPVHNLGEVPLQITSSTNDVLMLGRQPLRFKSLNLRFQIMADISRLVAPWHNPRRIAEEIVHLFERASCRFW